jgi:Ca2+-binding RTX toxin-like protein
VAIGAAGGPTPAQFADFWKKMAVQFKDYPALVGYDLMNEPHGMPVAGVWKAAAQAATDAIRTVDMDNVIYIEGEGWSGAHSWMKYNSGLIINDPANKIVYQAHQYFDDNNSGTYDETYEGENAYAMVGVDRLKGFVDWLKANNLKGMIGETGVPSSDPRWLEVMKNALDYMKANDLDVTLWGGGTWFPTTYSMYMAKPGQLDSAYMNSVEGYFNDYVDDFVTVPPPVPPSVVPAPSVAVNDVTVNEADGVMTFTVTRTGDLTGSSTVNYATANGTAVASSDYTAAAGTVSFAAGQATATVKVLVINDTLVESAETLTLNLSGGTNVTIGRGQGVGTIKSEDVAPPPPPPTVAVNDVTVNEADGVMTFTVTRTGDLTGSSTVNYATANGTAVAGSDYTAATGTVSFAAGQATATVKVLVINDTLVESAETLTLNLSGGTNLTIGDGQGVATINSEDLAPPPASPGTITGTDAGETINGTSSNDLISALGGNDVINGRGGADRLTGGAGSDRFVFDSQANAGGDVVTDFDAGLDKLDFSAIDADPFRKGDQKFTWLDTGAFTGKAGQLREYNQDGKHFVAGDLNGDRLADFAIEVAGTTDLSSTDILGTMNSAPAGKTKVMGFIVGFADDTRVKSQEASTVDQPSGGNVTFTGGHGVSTVNSEDMAALSTIAGTDAGEAINGTSGNDIIDALGMNDVINGGGRADRLAGGAGSDWFVFDSRAKAAGDVVTKFSVGFDVLGFRSIDANPFRKGDQKFTWLDTGASTGKAGQLRGYDQYGKHFVAGDTNGDRIADLAVEVAGTTNLTSADILL